MYGGKKGKMKTLIWRTNYSHSRLIQKFMEEKQDFDPDTDDLEDFFDWCTDNLYLVPND